MKQPKPFKSIDQQLDILENRGVIIDDRERAGRFLLSENYYSVINGYKDAFLDKDKTNEVNEVYREGTSFEELRLLYVFDQVLKRHTLNVLLNAENRMKATTIYAFCERNQGDEDYLDPACYMGSDDYKSKRHYSRNLIRLLAKLQSISSNKHIECIGHYLRWHGFVPLWVMAQEITFGTMSAFYELQKLPVKQAACRYMEHCTGNHIAPNGMRRAFKVLSQFRNICAHDDRLYCARVGRNQENSFKDLIEQVALVTPKDEMAAYAENVLACIESLFENGDDSIAGLGGCVLSTMQVDVGSLRAYASK